MAAALTLIVPDYTLLAVVAFAPLLLVFAFTGVPGDQGARSLGCAVASTVGGVLTHGLVSRWGEIYPRWIWFKAGKACRHCGPAHRQARQRDATAPAELAVR